MKRVCFIGGSCFLVSHEAEGDAGREMSYYRQNIAVNHCHCESRYCLETRRVWNRCTHQEYKAHGTELTAGSLCWRVSFLLSPGRVFAPFLCATRQLILQGWGSSLGHLPGKRILCIGQWNSLPRSVQRAGVGEKLGVPSCTGKAKTFHHYLASLLLTPAAPYESLRLAEKTGHQHHTSLLSSCHPCLALEPAGKHRLLKATGPFWRRSCTYGHFCFSTSKVFSYPRLWCSILLMYWAREQKEEQKSRILDKCTFKWV